MPRGDRRAGRRDPPRSGPGPHRAGQGNDRADRAIGLLRAPSSRSRGCWPSFLDRPEVTRAIVFTRTKHGADRVAEQLGRSGIRAEAMHGNKSQAARQRTLASFKSNRTRVLVATDLAARGIDVDGVSHVFNYDLPHEPETYVHRIGRTGRAGATGVAVSFCDDEERRAPAGHRTADSRTTLTIDKQSPATRPAMDNASHARPKRHSPAHRKPSSRPKRAEHAAQRAPESSRPLPTQPPQASRRVLGTVLAVVSKADAKPQAEAFACGFATGSRESLLARLEHFREPFTDALLATRRDPEPDIAEVVGLCGQCGNVAGPALAVAERDDE